MAKDIRRRQARRLRFLKLVYDKTTNFYNSPEARPSSVFMLDVNELAQELEISQGEANQIADYLCQERLIKRQPNRGISLDHAGRKEIENAICHTDQPAEHFPANVVQYIVNIQHAGNVAIGNDAQASSSSPDESDRST